MWFFSYISVKNIMFYTEFFIWKVDLLVFSLVWHMEKKLQIIENKLFFYGLRFEFVFLLEIDLRNCNNNISVLKFLTEKNVAENGTDSQQWKYFDIFFECFRIISQFHEKFSIWQHISVLNDWQFILWHSGLAEKRIAAGTFSNRWPNLLKHLYGKNESFENLHRNLMGFSEL